MNDYIKFNAVIAQFVFGLISGLAVLGFIGGVFVLFSEPLNGLIIIIYSIVSYCIATTMYLLAEGLYKDKN